MLWGKSSDLVWTNLGSTVDEVAINPIGLCVDDGNAVNDLNPWGNVEDAIIIAACISVSTSSLNSIDLSRNGIGDDSAVALAEALKVNASLNSLK